MRVANHRPFLAMPSRWERIVPPVAAALLALQAARLAWAFLAWPESVGVDYHLYLAAAQRWLASGSLYLPHQIAGPYAINQVVATDPLYPPVILWLLVPFVYLPAVLWWAIPMALTGWSLARLRPSPSAWLVISVLFLPAASWQSYLWGGPSFGSSPSPRSGRPMAGRRYSCFSSRHSRPLPSSGSGAARGG